MAADNSAMTRLMLDIFDLEGRRSDSDELLRGFGDRLRVTFGLDSVEAKVVEKGAISPAEEFAINTMKPFVDNRLSSYSQFKELVDSFNLGYKSCAIVPIASNGKALAVMKMLSKREERFDGDILGALSVSTMVIGSQMASKMEQEKSVSVAKYFDAAFNSVVPQALVDSAGAIVKANKSMLILFSASTKEMAGRNVKELFEIDANMLAALRGGRTAETKIANRGDRRFKVSSSAVNDKIMHIAFYETTELRDLEERMKMLKYSGYEALLMMDPKTKILWVSDNVEKVAKFNRDSIIGKKLLDLVIDRGKLAATIGALGNSVVTDSARVSIGNGNYQDMRISLFKNDLYGLSCILVNNAVENAYKTIERNFDELVKLSGDAILFVDQLGYIQRMNKSAENILGYREQEIVGSPANMIYSTQQEQDRFLRWLADTRQQGAINNVFAMLKTRKPDTAIPCEISIRSFYDQDGNLSGYVVVARELQTKRALEVAEDQLDEKERMIDKLGEESELKSQFIFNISHDIKTPITNIKGFASILNNGEHGELNTEQKEYISIIMNESDRLMELIMQILDVAKLSSGKIKLDLQPVDFRELEKNPSIKAQEEVAAGKGLMFSWNVDYSVGEIKVDPNRMIQVFVNLLTNAIKFTEHGSIVVSITKKGKSIRVEVRDTGIGISKEDQRKLFKKFYQVHREGMIMQKNAGTGLGLSIVKEIVNLHGGRMGVNSELGKGSTFWFTIPMLGKQKKEKRQKEREGAARQEAG